LRKLEEDQIIFNQQKIEYEAKMAKEKKELEAKLA
jgi:hypothetical protein